MNAYVAATDLDWFRFLATGQPLLFKLKKPFNAIAGGGYFSLRSDVHRLFDAGYVTVTPEYRVEAGQRMKDDFNDGDNYLKLHGTQVWVPESMELRPEASTLAWHNEHVFRG